MGSTSNQGENFCLKWNDFASSVSGSFQSLRTRADFFDVTLACGEGRTGRSNRTIRAHRVILAACSDFFRDMLQNCSPASPNPFIYLRGVNMTDLEAILDFMYQGEVNVSQEDLTSFLAVAEELQVKGLTNHDPNLISPDDEDLPPTEMDKTTKRSASGSSSSMVPMAKRTKKEPEAETSAKKVSLPKPGGNVSGALNVASDHGFDEESNSVDDADIIKYTRQEVEDEDYEDGFEYAGDGIGGHIGIKGRVLLHLSKLTFFVS